MKQLLLFLIVICIASCAGVKQSPQQNKAEANAHKPHTEITPLHEFFQENYDTTIIYHNWSSWYSAPTYIIVAIQKNRFYYFTYRSPYRKILGRPFPGNLDQHFREEERKFQETAPDVNRYLLSGTTSQDVLSNHWNELQQMNLWTLQDDSYGLTSTGDCMVDDGLKNTFYLISNEGIKTLNFYEPEFWEKCLGSDQNRQKAIQAITIFQTIAKGN